MQSRVTDVAYVVNGFLRLLSIRGKDHNAPSAHFLLGTPFSSRRALVDVLLCFIFMHLKVGSWAAMQI